MPSKYEWEYKFDGFTWPLFNFCFLQAYLVMRILLEMEWEYQFVDSSVEKTHEKI